MALVGSRGSGHGVGRQSGDDGDAERGIHPGCPPGDTPGSYRGGVLADRVDVETRVIAWKLVFHACNPKFHAQNLWWPREIVDSAHNVNVSRYISDMKSRSVSRIGTLVPISGYDPRLAEEYHVDAFVPHELPTTLTLQESTWPAITGAATELGRLDAAADLVPNPQLITRIAARTEAVGTSAIEGTFAELADLYTTDALPSDEGARQAPPQVVEVLNYARAAEEAYSWISERPITISMLSALQQEIVRDTESDGPEAGALRTTQVFVGARDRPIRQAHYVPPPPGDQLRSLLEHWVGWLTDPVATERLPLLAWVAMAHFQFEAIHPYTDGNGRLGRLVVVLQMLREGALRHPVISISSWLHNSGAAYREELGAVGRTGDWDAWITFFAQAIASAARADRDRIGRVAQLRDEIAATVRQHLPRAALAREIAEGLIDFPVLSVGSAHRRYGRSEQANRAAINQLIGAGLLEQYGDADYRRLYWSPRVFQAIAG